MEPGAELGERYRVGPYPLARGGMGEVWPADDMLLRRSVIVKVLPRTDDLDLVRRFRREALLTARLDHPGVPVVFDLGRHHGREYLVLQRVDGITLADLSAEQGPLAMPWVVSIGAQMSAVLMAAQAIGLVHRDIKPSNAMLEPSGTVKVLDFGLAAIHRDDRYSRITRSGQSLGTVGYMAPEQIMGEPTDHRSDLYGLGATLYHLATGQPPFDGETTDTTVRHQLVEPPRRVSVARPDVPPPLDDLIDQLLSADPAARPSGAADVYATLTAHAAACPPIPRVIDDRHPVRAYAVAAAGVGGASGLGASGPASGEPRAGRPGAESDADEADRLFAAGQFRAAARMWRQLADRRARTHGDSDPQVFEWRVQAARAHLRMGEHDRGVRQLDTLLHERIGLVGPDDATVHELRQEITALQAAGPAPD